PHYDLKHLRTLDSRIEAHLDGLLIAGLKGLDLLLKALSPHATGEVFAATALAFMAGNGPALSSLAEHLRKAPDGERGFTSALGWLDWATVEPWI
ncbi:hypothetical protein OZH93_24570, partial [Escherichia coli]|uniref:hypothetical protein n=1 Tax=Escherichia coli TaxID=562 RepID=UPI002283D7E4